MRMKTALNVCVKRKIKTHNLCCRIKDVDSVGFQRPLTIGRRRNATCNIATLKMLCKCFLRSGLLYHFYDNNRSPLPFTFPRYALFCDGSPSSDCWSFEGASSGTKSSYMSFRCKFSIKLVLKLIVEVHLK